MPQTFRTIVPRAIIVALVSIASTVAAPASRATDADTSVHVETPLGAFDIRLFPGSAPITVANFLEYVNDGDYENSFVHRKVSGFVIQGGGFVFNNNATISVVRARAPIPNEFSLSNLRGTIAMAKVGGDPNSATSQWFINLSDNGDTLDSDNGGYAVFGEVVGDGMSVVDAMAAAPTFPFGEGLTAVPLINYTSSDPPVRENMILTMFTDTSSPDLGSIKPVLLRNARTRRWRSYRLRFERDAVRITQKGPVGLTRNAAFEVVSRGDFDGDLEPDVLLRDTGGARRRQARGSAAASGWLLATLVGKKMTSNGAVDLTTDPEFEVVSTADFNRDGKADVLLRNPVDDSWLLYRLAGQTVLSELRLSLGTQPTDRLVSTADFNADGRADFLLQRADGTWLLNASTTTGGYQSAEPKIDPSAKYTVQAVADFDGDDFTDVLMREDKGGWSMYLLDGAGVRKKATPRMSKDTDYRLESHADFNGDGNADVLLRHADGSWYLYSLDGRKILSEGSLEMSADPEFEVASITDFNGDRKADVLARHAKGNWMLYILDGDGPSVIASGAAPLPKSNNWVLQPD